MPIVHMEPRTIGRSRAQVRGSLDGFSGGA
jgi:hypothetical protein